MPNYQELMQMVVDASDEQRIALGKQALGDAINIFIKYGLTHEQTTIFVKDLIKLFVGADGTCSKKELDLVNAICECHFSKEIFYEMTRDGDNPEFVERILDVIDSIPSNEKTGLCLFGLSLLASDEEMNQKEQDLFIRISE